MSTTDETLPPPAESTEPPQDDWRDAPQPSRVPPQDNGAERYVLGAMMLSREAVSDSLLIVSGPDFYRPAHEMIFDAILDLYGLGEPIDVVTVANLLTKNGKIQQVGGALYLSDLAASPPVGVTAAYYAQIVADKAAARRLIEAATKIAQRAYAQEGEVAQMYDAAMSDLTGVALTRRGADYVRLAEVLDEEIEAIEAHNGTGELLGVPSGFFDLDELIGGFKAGQMVVVAGRPAQGKSTLAVDFLRAACLRANMTGCYFSLEMTRREIVRRMISAEAKVALNKINAGLLSEQDWDKMSAAIGRIYDAPLFIDDSANLTMTEIAAKARRLKADHDLRVIMIDYLQLMSSGRRVENRQAEVSEFSRQIKLLAKELEVPVIALSQLNRAVEQRSTKRPLMSDLRESGSIEQDADIIILLHRDDAYDPESSRPGEADLIVAKHRNGQTRDVVVVAQHHYARFVDMAAS